MSLWFDRIVIGGIVLLILATPLAFGSVHPWTFSLVEGIVFFLVAVWMSKLFLFPSSSYPPKSVFLPLLLFVSLILFQLLPLPPAVLRSLSPSTYELYVRSLPGWPERIPYAVEESQREVSGPTADALIPHSRLSIPQPQSSTFGAQWRPLSIAPALTYTDLVKFLAYTALFHLVFLYPVSPSPKRDEQVTEERFLRIVLLTVLVSGLLVACIGLIQWCTWNGKILWFFVPYDWGAPHIGEYLRASGPFVNPDHFANYLTLVFPVTLVGILSPRSFVSQRFSKAFRLLCGLVTCVLLMGILLSLSRSAWTGTIIGTGILLWGILSLSEEKRSSLLRMSRKTAARLSALGVVLLLALALFFVGPLGRSLVDVRLEETVLQDAGLDGRMSLWKDSLGMIRDFPLSGVGLGVWPELFPRYQSPPWSPTFYREAHNDYLELLAETGFTGFFLLAWFFWGVGRMIVCNLHRLCPSAVPMVTTLLAALGVMAFHECFDFNLQIPANAFLFTLFLALALRIVRGGLFSGAQPLTPSRPPPLFMIGVGVAACLLFVIALNQERLPYPHRLTQPTSVIEAQEALFSHPARASLHLALFHLLEQELPFSKRLNELAIALWLDPRNPYVRDLYAAGLLREGKEEVALEEITRSIFFSPSISTHSYLNPRLISWLSAREQQAVEEGFRLALANGREEAVEGMGVLYAAGGRLAEKGELYKQVALRQTDQATKVRYLLEAAGAYIKAGDDETAEVLLRQVATMTPRDPRPYQYLATRIFAPRGAFDLAKTVLSEGLQNRADPFALSLSLAECAQQIGDQEEVKEALLQALRFQPSSFDTYMRLSLLYIQEKNFGRAVLSLRKALEINPNSAVAFDYLGVAEEGRYRFFAAEKAYAQAVKLEPGNTSFQQRYSAFLQKVTNGGE